MEENAVFSEARQFKNLEDEDGFLTRGISDCTTSVISGL